MIGNKVEIIEHDGKEIMHMIVDVNNANDLDAILRMALAYMKTREFDSVRSCIELIDMPMSDSALIVLKKILPETQRYVYRSSIVPTDTLLRAFIMELNKTREKKFNIFKDKEEAYEWLVYEEEKDEFTTII